MSDTLKFFAEGIYTPATSITCSSSGHLLASADSHATVNLAQISAFTPGIWATEGQSIDGTLGTFTDSAGIYATGNYTASIVFDGDTSHSYTNITLVPDGQNDGGYSVQASGLPILSPGWHTLTLTVTETDSTLGQSVQATSNAAVHIADAPLTLASDTVSSLGATEGQPLSGELLHFTDADPNAQASDYSATVNWGDGSNESTADANSHISIVADSAGGFDVVGSHTFEAGYWNGSVDVQDIGGSSVTSTPSFSVSDVPLTQVNDVPTTASGIEGQAINNIKLLHFTDADPNAVAGQYTATVNWGDGTSDTINGTDTAITLTTDPAGGFDVIGAHPYATKGNYGITVTVFDHGGSTLGPVYPVTAMIADAPLTLASDSPMSFSGVEGQTFNGTVLHFTDADPGAVATQYTTIIDWGNDPPTSNGITVTSDGAGGFVVDSGHAFAAAGTFTVTVSITDSGGSTVSNTLTATITPAAPTGLTATPVNTGAIDLEWQPYTGEPNPENEAVYVQRSLSPDNGFTTVSANLTGYGDFYMDDDPPLAEGTHYYYRVEVTESSLTTDSPVVDAWTPPAAPTALTATTISASEIDLSWTNSASNYQNIEIDRSTSPDLSTFLALACDTRRPSAELL